MKAIIISDMDARALLDKLKLESMREDGHFRSMDRMEQPPSIASIHRVFHYVVTKWLQEQGADCVGC